MRIWLAALLIGAVATSASADPETYHSLKYDISKRADCKHSELRTTTAYRCEKDQSLWYFTKEKNPAHPAVIKRFFVSTPDGGVVREQVWSADPQAPAFQKWRKTVEALEAGK
ncbi:MAG TPA: hypothetical protein VGG48_03450 [Rhizomicrobium sp.]|jgi:hypothetical protein